MSQQSIHQSSGASMSAASAREALQSFDALFMGTPLGAAQKGNAHSSKPAPKRESVHELGIKLLFIDF